MSFFNSVKSRKEAQERWYQLLVDEEDTRTCKDIPQEACSNIAQNFFIILLTQLLTKIADSLANAKTVLPWILNASGAPAGMTALLVPIRESGSMIPQLLIGGVVRKHKTRKQFYVFGCVAQAIFILCILLSGMYLNGLQSGIAIIFSLVLFSLSRGLCSVASKDVIGKTIPKTRRGRLIGISASISGLLTIVIALLMVFGIFNQSYNFIPFICLAASFWLIAAFTFSQVKEQDGATEGGGNAFYSAISKFSLLKTDIVFRNFVVMRALLMSSGLTAPFLVTIVMTSEEMPSSVQLGLFVGLSGLASLISGHIWGKMSDNNSLRVMIIAGVFCSLICSLALLFLFLNIKYLEQFTLVLFFLLMITHEGVRLGRKTYVLDMASGNKRTDYVTLSNTLIGVLLLIVGAFTSVLAQYSLLAVFAFFLICSASAAGLGILESNKNLRE
jgi:MFS family permease